MMIGPGAYYEFHLKGKNVDQIMTAIRGLKQEIGRLKPVKIHGSNAYPYNFDRLLDLLNIDPWSREDEDGEDEDN